MYIEKLVMHNFGKIDRFALDKDDLLKLDCSPKPIILLGKNGAGKTTLLSSIADSFFEVARSSGFNDVLPINGAGYKYFKVSGGTNQKTGTDYGLCFVKYTNGVQYLNKSGKLPTQDCISHIAETTILPNYKDEGNVKLNNAKVTNNNNAIQTQFENNSYLYFSSDRFEYPEWLGNNFIDESFDDKTISGGELGRKILVRNNLNNIKQWIKNVILDSRVEVETTLVDGQSMLRIVPHHMPNLSYANSKINIEAILSKIMEQDIKLNLGYRVQGNRRLSLIDSSGVVVAPSLESLSAGQSTLLSIFCSIIQASDMQDINKSVQLGTIEGIVLIDEVDLHLHIKLQKDILPQLIKLFPRVQFIVSSHSPFFLKGMHDVFGDDMLMVNMPDGEKLNDFNNFEEFENAFNLFDFLGASYKQELLLLKSKISNQQKPLVITEGKTDWKHLKAALNYFKSVDEYTDLDIDFLEDNETRGDSILKNMLDSSRRLSNNHHIIGIFDRDNQTYTRKYHDVFHPLGNKVFAFCIPEPSHRVNYKNISIEFYYKDEDINKQLTCGTKLFFSNEVKKKHSRGIR